MAYRLCYAFLEVNVELLLMVLGNTVEIIILLLQLAMFVRAILSWFPMEENRFIGFLYAVTEPVILPVRMLFERLGWFQNLPIDISFFVTFLLLSLIGGLL